MADIDAGLPEGRLSKPATGGSPSRSGLKIGVSRWISLATIAAALGAWWLATYLVLLPPLFLPSPEMVLRQVERVLTVGFVDATLSQHLLASLGRIFAALALAIATAVPAGLAVGLNPVARGCLDPIIEFYRPIPPLAYLPLIVIWFGIGEFSKIL